MRCTPNPPVVLPLHDTEYVCKQANGGFHVPVQVRQSEHAMEISRGVRADSAVAAVSGKNHCIPAALFNIN
jgi:hypothetical protein